MATSALRQAAEEPVSYFDLPFTAAPNDLLKDVYSDPTTPPKTRLLLLITRFSTGYRQLSVILKENFILEETRMCRSALYRAKSQLVTAGKVVIRHTKTGHCVYELAAHLQSLKAARQSTRKDIDSPQPATPPIYIKETKENNITETQIATVSEAVFDDVLSRSIDSSTECTWRGNHQPANTASPVASDQAQEVRQEPIPEKAIPQAVVSKEFRPAAWRSDATEPKPVSSLTRKLVDIGVHEFLAFRLTKTHSQELIEAALARVSTSGTIINRAGYLVAELSRGGYQAAPVCPLTLAKERNENIHQIRTNERARADQAREESNRERVLTPLQRFETLDALEKDKILLFLDKRADSEGFSSIPHWNSDHPVYRGLLAETIAQHFSGNKLERAEGE